MTAVSDKRLNLLLAHTNASLAAARSLVDESSIDGWLRLWRALPASQRAAAAMCLRGEAMRIAGTLAADADSAEIGPDLTIRARRLDASAIACGYLSALLAALAYDADRHDAFGALPTLPDPPRDEDDDEVQP